MITQSGICIETIGGKSGTPTAEDIAIHAGRLCRFGGAVWYPLLPHLVLVGLLAYRRSGKVENLLWGFLHDAHECVTGDVPRPFKCDCMRWEQQAIDRRILAAFFTPQQAAQIDFDLVHTCDRDACDLEAMVLGVPGYVQHEQPRAIYWDAEEARLLWRILHSRFCQDTIYSSSTGQQSFARALQAPDYTALLAEVESWRLD